MKTLAFVAGVAAGSLATVGVAIGSVLISLNKVSDGEVAKVIGYALDDVKNIFLDKEKNVEFVSKPEENH
jgi:beta-lactam-binding protein with PASTA domain